MRKCNGQLIFHNGNIRSLTAALTKLAVYFDASTHCDGVCASITGTQYILVKIQLTLLSNLAADKEAQATASENLVRLIARLAETVENSRDVEAVSSCFARESARGHTHRRNRSNKSSFFKPGPESVTAT